MIPGGEIVDWLEDVHRMALSGFSIALHLGLHAPRYQFQTLPDSWIAAYLGETMILHDPTLAWGLAHEGRVGWDDLAGSDPAGILARAADHGLAHGLTVATASHGTRTIGSFARPDRPFHPDEADRLEQATVGLHAVTSAPDWLDESQHEVLRRLSVAFTRP